MSVAIRNSFKRFDCIMKKAVPCCYISYIEVNASTFITVKETKELLYKHSRDSGREKKTVEVLQLLLAELSARALIIETSEHSRNELLCSQDQI